MENYAEAMRSKRRAFWALVAALCAVLLLCWRFETAIQAALGGWVAVPGLALLLAAARAANLITSCPKCGERLPSILYDEVCSKCAAVLSDRPVEAGPARRADSRALAYMEGSRRILAGWAVLRVRLRKSIWWTGGATAAGLSVWFRTGGKELSESIGVGLFVGLIMTGISWLLLHHVADNFFGIGFMVLRGRCPVCKAWFKQPTTVGVGEIQTDYSLPNVCVSCRAPLA